jgi:hypothetical protein
MRCWVASLVAIALLAIGAEVGLRAYRNRYPTPPAEEQIALAACLGVRPSQVALISCNSMRGPWPNRDWMVMPAEGPGDWTALLQTCPSGLVSFSARTSAGWIPPPDTGQGAQPLTKQRAAGIALGLANQFWRAGAPGPLHFYATETRPEAPDQYLVRLEPDGDGFTGPQGISVYLDAASGACVCVQTHGWPR